MATRNKNNPTHAKVDAVVEQLKNIMWEFEELASDCENEENKVPENVTEWVGKAHMDIESMVEDYPWQKP